MLRFRTILLSLLSAITLYSSTMADDLGFVTISKQQSAEIAARLLGTAFAKSGDRFLVSTNQEMRDSLSRYGIPFETVLTNTLPNRHCLIHSADRGKADESAVARIGRNIDLGDGLFLVETSHSAAASIGEQERLFVVLLENQKIHIHYTPVAVPFRFGPNDIYPTDTLVGRVNKDSVMAWDQRLERFYTRYIWSDSTRKAREWMISKFQQWGYTQISTPSFSYGGGTLYNLKVVKPGYAEPDKIIVIGGHYDAINFESSGYTYCPGADDDASGVTVTMEVARILANVPLRKTIVFMPFNAEEVGLIGSRAAALDFKNTGALVEAMFNYDMVGFVADGYWDLDMSSGSNSAYRTLNANSATRLTGLIPNIVGLGSSSDHFSFHEQGFDVSDNIEGDFNSAGWHTNLDVSSRMNFDYLTDVAKMAAASIAIAANSAYPVSVSQIVDIGNGTQLEVRFANCIPSYQYTVYYGTSPGIYTDSIAATPGVCSQVVSGLTQGVTYHLAVYGKPADGYRALWAGESSEVPLTVPRPPTAVSASPGDYLVNLDWADNTEADISSYNVYRRIAGQSQYEMFQSGVTSSSLVDSQVASGLLYQYVITSVDQGGLESSFSIQVECYPATFDAGVLVVDEITQDYSYLPDEAHQAAFFDSIMGSLDYAYLSLSTLPDSLTMSTAGRQSSIIWDDDDLFNKIISGSTNTLAWYLGNQVNMFICGYRSLSRWSGPSIPTNHLLYTEFMVAGYDYTNFDYFDKADGQNGWPSIQWDPNRGVRYYRECPVLFARPGATVVLLNDSPTDNEHTEGMPIALAYSGPHGKRVILTVPLYYLTPASASAFMAKVLEYFGESNRPAPGGDNNNSGFVDLSDLSALIGYLTTGIELVNRNGADVDHSCSIDLSDLSRTVSYLSTGKPVLVAGCVTP